jgi:hypothetical protein
MKLSGTFKKVGGNYPLDLKIIWSSDVLVMEIGWTDVESGGYILVNFAHSNTTVKLVF